jgi:hypothetical protein
VPISFSLKPPDIKFNNFEKSYEINISEMTLKPNLNDTNEEDGGNGPFCAVGDKPRPYPTGRSMSCRGGLYARQY